MGSSSIMVRPMGPMLQAMMRFGQNLFQPQSDTIRNIDANAWYSPLQPVKPWGPDGTEPRAFQYWSGQNLIWTPRADAEYSAADLKQLAMYPLARICIENVKDSMSRVPWEVQLKSKPGETKKQAADRAKGNADLVKMNKFFEQPDREHNWTEWLRPLLDDMLVIDAPAILVRKTFKGEIVELPVVRGDSIVRYIDENGFTPMAPQPAYAQNWWGIPLVNLTTDQLVYKPRNIVPRNTVSSQLYGMSPTEQLATEIKVGIKRLEFTLDYYTEGSIPGVVQVVPRGTTPDKIAEAMTWMNSELAGNLAARRQWRMVQGFNEPGKNDQIEFTKEPLLADQFDELHIRKICFGYGTSPQRLMRMMGTRNAAEQQEAAELEGLIPWLIWLKGVRDHIVQRIFGYTDFESTYDASREPDPEKQASSLKVLAGSALLTKNEARAKLGEEPRNEPEADMLGIDTGTGFVPIGMASAMAGAEVDASGKTTVKEKPNGSADSSVPPKGKNESAAAETGGGEPKKGGAGADSAATKANGNGSGNGKGHCGEHRSYDDACLDCARQEIRRLEKQASPLQAAVGSTTVTAPTPRGPIGFYHEPVVNAVPFTNVPLVSTGVIKNLHHPHHAPKAIIHPGRLTPHSHLAQHSIERVLHNAFKGMARTTIAVLQKDITKFFKRQAKRSKTGVHKADADEQARMLARLLAQLQGDWSKLPDELYSAYEGATLSGALEGAAQLSISDSLLGDINKVARDWAQQRAAELVGMRRTEDGALIPNPDAKWAISDTTRDDLRNLISRVFERDVVTLSQIEQDVLQAGIFSDTRASMIARTEVARAQSVGNLETWKQSGMVETVEWELSGSHDLDDDCDEYAAESPYDIDDVPDHPAHPNCDCVLTIGTITREDAADSEGSSNVVEPEEEA